MRTLLDLLGIRAGELRAVLPAFALAFLSVGALGLSGIAADTLFVSAFSLGEISRFYVVSSVVRVAVAFGYAALARRFDGPRFDAAVFAAAALEMMISAAAVDHGRSAIYVACVAQLLLPPLLPLVAFNRVMSCFHVRQAKRLLPLIAAAATLGSIVVGAGAGPIAVGFGTRALLFAGGALCIVSLPLPGLLAARAGEAQGDTPAPAPNEGGGLRATLRDTVRDIRTVAVVRVVVVNAFLAAAATNLVDFAFKAALKERYGRDEMASFLGAFNVAANTVVLFAQIFLTSRFVGRFGVRASLRAFPASLLVLGPAIGAAAGVATGAAAKFAEIALRFSLGAAVADLILTPSSPQVRTRAKVFVKGIAGPLGYLAAGVILAIFGAGGPPPIVLGALLFAVGLCGVLALAGARRAYTSALAKALGEGRIELDVSPNAAAVLRDELARIVARSSAEGDTRTAIRTLAILGDRFFDLRDIAPALHSPFPEIRRAAVQAALRVARPGEGESLLAMAPPDEDDEVEVKLLAGARSLGAVPPRDRIERALARTSGAPGGATSGAPGGATSGATSGPAIDLWAEALLCLALTEKDPAVKKLRKAAAEDEPAASARRAAALRALGDLRERRAEREVLRAMASSDPAVFAQAARAAVLIEAQGAIPTLITALLHGSNIRAAGRALALAGPSAINELIAALPTTRGEGAVAPTAVASAREITGTVRAARVLARLGPEACARVLARFSDLGYRGRNAVARAFASMKWSAGRAVDEGTVTRAMELTLSYAETLTLAAPHVWATAGQDLRSPSNETPLAGQNPRPASNLLAHEIRHRTAETAARMLDLASVIGDRALIARARSGLAREERDRGHALELLENVLPKPLAARCVAVLEQGAGDRPALQAAGEGNKLPAERAPADARRPVVFDGWLEKCRKFDKNELPSGDPMLGVLEKVLVLSGASLFAGLSGEELYPVAEIAEATLFASGDTVVRQGDPGDALFVVASGTFVIVKGETKVHELGEGAVFGELALLDGAPRAATVVAASDGQLLRIPRAEFEALLDESPELARGVIRTLVGHLRGGT